MRLSSFPRSARMEARRAGVPSLAIALAGLVLSLAVALRLSHRGSGHSPLPRYGQLPVWTLQDQAGNDIGTRQLRGTVYVAQFASSAEPVSFHNQAAAAAGLPGLLAARGSAARLVTFDLSEQPSVEARRAAAAPHVSDPARWRVVGGGEVAALGTRALEAMPSPLAHGCGCDARNLTALGRSGLLVLLDAAGEIRGFYDVAREPRELLRLVDDLTCLEVCGPVPELRNRPGDLPVAAACSAQGT